MIHPLAPEPCAAPPATAASRGLRLGQQQVYGHAGLELWRPLPGVMVATERLLPLSEVVQGDWFSNAWLAYLKNVDPPASGLVMGLDLEKWGCLSLQEAAPQLLGVLPDSLLREIILRVCPQDTQGDEPGLKWIDKGAAAKVLAYLFSESISSNPQGRLEEWMAKASQASQPDTASFTPAQGWVRELRDMERLLAGGRRGAVLGPQRALWVPTRSDSPERWKIDLARSGDPSARMLIGSSGDGYYALAMRGAAPIYRLDKCRWTWLEDSDPQALLHQIEVWLGADWIERSGQAQAQGAQAAAHTRWTRASDLNMRGLKGWLNIRSACPVRARLMPGSKSSLPYTRDRKNLIDGARYDQFKSLAARVRELGGSPAQGVDATRLRVAQLACEQCPPASLLEPGQAGVFLRPAQGPPIRMERRYDLSAMESATCHSLPAGFAHQALPANPRRLRAEVKAVDVLDPANPFVD